ncbi:MAG: NUDIX hydrolase [bacterium]|nr:NUDIX hydrolase [bacterium]
MRENRFWQRLSTFLRRLPWIVSGMYLIWRVFQTKYSLGVVGIVFNAQGQVLLVEHVFHPKRPWGLPGGWVNRREDPAAAIQREFLEELQLHINPDVLLLAEFHKGNHLDLAYLCSTTGTIGQLSYELLGYRWHDLAELPRLYPFQQRAIAKAIDFRETYGIHE